LQPDQAVIRLLGLLAGFRVHLLRRPGAIDAKRCRWRQERTSGPAGTAARRDRELGYRDFAAPGMAGSILLHADPITMQLAVLDDPPGESAPVVGHFDQSDLTLGIHDSL